VFDVLGIDDCRDILDLLIESPEPLTQGQIAAVLGLKSSLASRRMAEIEKGGLVTRASPHAPYDLAFPTQVHRVLELGADLASEVADRKATGAKSHKDERRKRGMRGSALTGSAKESS
jgi:DNA-binding IclR family transcriptional regulator